MKLGKHAKRSLFLICLIFVCHSLSVYGNWEMGRGYWIIDLLTPIVSEVYWYIDTKETFYRDIAIICSVAFLGLVYSLIGSFLGWLKGGVKNTKQFISSQAEQIQSKVVENKKAHLRWDSLSQSTHQPTQAAPPQSTYQPKPTYTPPPVSKPNYSSAPSESHSIPQEMSQFYSYSIDKLEAEIIRREAKLEIVQYRMRELERQRNESNDTYKYKSRSDQEYEWNNIVEAESEARKEYGTIKREIEDLKNIIRQKR